MRAVPARSHVHTTGPNGPERYDLMDFLCVSEPVLIRARLLWSNAMLDLMMFLATVVFFVLALAYVRGCAHLRGETGGKRGDE